MRRIQANKVCWSAPSQTRCGSLWNTCTIWHFMFLHLLGASSILVDCCISAEEDAEEALQEGPSGAQQTTRQPDQDAERRASGAQASTSSSSSTSSSTPTVLPNGPQRQQQQQEHRQQQQRQQQAPGSSGSGSSTQGAAGPRPGQGAGAGVGDVATRQTYASCLPAGIRPAGVEGGSGRVVLDPVYASR
jgi:cytoskeletal protein RodZ